MKTRSMVCSLLLLTMSMPGPVSSADVEHGKNLVEEHCTRCHDSHVFTRPDHRIRSLEALQNQVERCEANALVNWPQKDVDDVVGYLDATFYKFSSAAAEAPK